MLLEVKRARLSEIARIVCEETGNSIERITADQRTRDVAWPRHVLYYFSRELTGLSFPRLGQMLNRDHSTIIYGAERVAKQPHRYEPTLSRVRNRIEKELLNGA